MLCSSISIRPKRKWLASSPWLLASLLLHASTLVVILLFVEGRPHGRGRSGIANDEAFSVTWIPGSAGQGGRELDTVIDGTDSGDSLETIKTEPAPPSSSKSTLVDVAETDPGIVFNDESHDSVLDRTSREERTTEISSKDSVSKPVADADRPQSITATSFRSQTNSAVNPSPSTDEPREIAGRRGRGGSNAGEGGSSRAGGDQIAFFGILSRGQRVVYVIDASESMRRHRAMEIARVELLLSLNELESTAKFQIVFFDLKTQVMGRPHERSKMLLATSSNLRLAEHFIKGVQPDAGTDRLAAVTHALTFDPDVIYLLTDADEPEMSAKDLWDIRRGNKRKSPIHVVEFGVGSDLNRDSFLKRLAMQNNGKHFYRDLTRSEH